MNLDEFYNFSNNTNYAYSFIMSKISNDKSYKYNESVINNWEIIGDTIETASNKQLLYIYNQNNEINIWKEIFRYLHWYICK